AAHCRAVRTLPNIPEPRRLHPAGLLDTLLGVGWLPAQTCQAPAADGLPPAGAGASAPLHIISRVGSPPAQPVTRAEAGQHLRDRRDSLGMSHGQLGALVGISGGAVRSFEIGALPSVEVGTAIEATLRLQPGVLWRVRSCGCGCGHPTYAE